MKKNSDEKKFSEMTKEEKRKEIVSWVIWIAAAVIIAFGLRAFVFEFAVVNGDSMNNTLFNGEYVFVEKISKISGAYEYNDVLIVHYPNSTESYVKRLVGMEGDTIEISDGYLYRNGEKIEEPFIKDGYIYEDFSEITVPEGCVFVMGDNRNNSMDSRSTFVGPLKKEKIVGRAAFVLLPIRSARGIS